VSAQSFSKRALGGLLLSAGLIAGIGGGASAAERSEVDLLDRQTAFESSIDVVKTQNRYERVRKQARDLGLAAPSATGSGAPSAAGLETRLAKLRERVQRAELEQRAERKRGGGKRSPGAGKIDDPESLGVSEATLASIASCESGGDPSAVDPSGTYRGKYQFDTGTWASVGGSGDPAAAPEREQDYRAALLYSRAGSSPWPVCGS
jgi:hypothetical protein